jgi:hypothetical protein
LNRSNERKYQNTKSIISGRKRFLIIFLIIVLFFSIFQTTFSTVSAAGDDAEFNSIEISATPLTQGVGGEITITTKANFFGGCCYHLYAYDVQVEVLLPEGLKLIGSLPRKISTVDAQPGGQPTSTRFDVDITGIVPGLFEVEITVKTSNCGSISDTIWITITDGASISNPNIYPVDPSLEEDISVSVEIKSSSDDIEVLDTHMYIYTSKKEFDVIDLNAVNDTIRIFENSDGSFNEIEPIAINNGKKMPMRSSEFSNKWYAKINGYSKEVNIYVWFVAITSDGKNATSSVYPIQVRDLEQREFNLSAITWGTMFGIILGIILIIGLWSIYITSVKKSTDEKGFLKLGGKFYKEPYRPVSHSILKLQKQFAARRYFVIIFFIIIGVILLIWALYTGQFEELFNRTLEG